MADPTGNNGIRRIKAFGEKGGDINWGNATKGAGNQLLFGIPGAVYKNIGGDDAKAEMKRLEADPSYQGGEVAGTVGSGFIPIAGIAGRGVRILKGGAEVAQGANAVSQGGRLSKLLNPIKTLSEGQALETAASKTLGGAVKNNVINSSAGEALREGSNGKFDLSDIATAGLIGGGATAATHGLMGKIFKSKELPGATGSGQGEYYGNTSWKKSGMPTKEEAETARNGVQAFGDMHYHIASLNDPSISKISSSLHQGVATPGWISNVSKVVKKYGLKPGDFESLNNAADLVAQKYSKLDEVMQPHIEKLQSRYLDPKFADDAVKAVDLQNIDPSLAPAISRTFDDVTQKLGQAKTPSEMRETINDALERAYAPGNVTGDARIVQSKTIALLKIIRNDMDNTASMAAIDAKMPGLVNTPTEYSILSDISKQMQAKFGQAPSNNGMGAGQSIINAVTGGGFRSAIGTAVNALPGVKRAVRGVRAAGEMHDVNAANKLFADSPDVADELAGTPGKVAAEAKAPTAGDYVKEKLTTVARDMGQSHGGSAIAGYPMAQDMASDKRIEDNKKEENYGKEIIPDISQSPLMESRIQNAWENAGYEAAFADSEEYDDYKKEFHDGFIESLQDGDGNINPVKFANAMFVNKTDIENFPRAYKIYASIFPRIDDAFSAPKGIPGVADTPIVKDIGKGLNIAAANAENANYNSDVISKSARDSVIGGAAEIGRASGKNGDTAADDAAQILITSKTPQEAKQKMIEYLRLNDQSAYTLLKQTGLVP